MVDHTASPIETAEDLLLLQDRWVTARIPALYARLKDLVRSTSIPRKEC
jgi:hypothetical protein